MFNALSSVCVVGFESALNMAPVRPPLELPKSWGATSTSFTPAVRGRVREVGRDEGATRRGADGDGPVAHVDIAPGVGHSVTGRAWRHRWRPTQMVRLTARAGMPLFHAVERRA